MLLLNKSFINVNVIGDTEIVAGVAEKRIYVRRLLLQANAEVTIKFREANTDISAPYIVGVKGSWVLDDSGLPWYKGGVGEGLDLNLSSAVQVNGEIWYEQQ